MIARLLALFVVLGVGALAFVDELAMPVKSESEEFVTGIGSEFSDAVYGAATWITGIIGI